MKVVVLGCNGQLGMCLYDQFENSGYEVVFTSREKINITNFKATKITLLDMAPDVIINATAYTAVDEAEEDQKTANLINHLAVANIAKVCKKLACCLIHVSTDYVFDGNSKIPYKEDDKTNPQSIYGDTKLKGELAIQSSECKHIIIRTAWLFSEYGNNFLKTMMRLGSERDELSIVSDQIGCPTYAQDIAKVIVQIIPYLNSQVIFGLYHYCGDQPCSWYDFARIIFREAKIRRMPFPRKINAIDSNSFPTKARRPQYSVLDSGLIESDFMVNASDWHEGIIKSIERLN